MSNLPTKKQFYFFQNHGDEEGNKGYTICYGDEEEDDENAEHYIVSCEDDEDEAIEACKRLNDIVDPLLAERDSLKEENETLKEKIEELTPSHPQLVQDVWDRDMSTLAADNLRLREALEYIVERSIYDEDHDKILFSMRDINILSKQALNPTPISDEKEN